MNVSMYASVPLAVGILLILIQHQRYKYALEIYKTNYLLLIYYMHKPMKQRDETY